MSAFGTGSCMEDAWGTLEDKTRKEAEDKGVMYVITGVTLNGNK